jgi:monoamine oxidase
MLHASYDFIVVGAGIAGLWMTRTLQRQYPTCTIALAERYKGLGGRTYSYSPPGFKGVQWEMGAGRIRKDHTMLMGLVKEYGLHWLPIGDAISYQAHPGDALIPNPFESVIVPVYIAPLAELSPSVLQAHTLEQILEKLYGKANATELLSYFPYRAEINVLRADLALKQFLGDGEMSSHKGYGVLQEGFGSLVEALRDEIERRGGMILNRHRLVGLNRAEGHATDLVFSFGAKGEPQKEMTLRATRACVLALHKDAVAELKEFSSWKVLTHLRTAPLLRCYAIFETPAWFEGMTRVVTPERPRYILPIDPQKGVVMISYTDADDVTDYAKIYEKGGDEALEKVVVNDVRKLFPDTHIPKPLFFRAHLWETGATYWTPGSYDAALESSEACHPLGRELPGVWMCGESWSLRQAWVEGALEHAKECFGALKKSLAK